MNSWERLIQIQRRTRPYLEAKRRPKACSFRVDNKGAETELFIYGEVGGPWGIKAEEIGKALRAASPAPVTIRLHSEGGSAFEGIAIHSLLRSYGGAVGVKIDGLAASAGSIIAVAGDTIAISPGGQVLIHDASAMTVGDAQDHRFMAGLLNTTSETIAGLYARRTGTDAATWRERMTAHHGLGSWYNAEQAVEFGLADEVLALEREHLAAQVAAGVFAGMVQARQDKERLVAAAAARALIDIMEGIKRGCRKLAAESREWRPRRWRRATGEIFGG